MNEWITDRVPKFGDGVNSLVYNSNGDVVVYTTIHIGEAWKPLPKCEPYVKPKRWEAKWHGALWCLYYDGDWDMNLTHLNKENDQHREAAERIKAIYEELYP